MEFQFSTQVIKGHWARCGQSEGRHETNKAQNTYMFVDLRVLIVPSRVGYKLLELNLSHLHHHHHLDWKIHQKWVVEQSGPSEPPSPSPYF